ncbi:MAG TPA: hypothetical protein VLY24_10680 [Bryobacteraceae bacterium]|nr:hypothetical protein [Bryobacteraceae bacterium]
MPFSSRPRHVQVARLPGAAREENGVELLAQVFHRNIHARDIDDDNRLCVEVVR